MILGYIVEMFVSLLILRMNRIPGSPSYIWHTSGRFETPFQRDPVLLDSQVIDQIGFALCLVPDMRSIEAENHISDVSGKLSTECRIAIS